MMKATFSLDTYLTAIDIGLGLAIWKGVCVASVHDDRYEQRYEHRN